MKLIAKETVAIIEKLSFIDSAKIKGADVVITYTTRDGKRHIKVVPRRASYDHLQMLLKNIKTEMGVQEYGKPNSTFFITAD